MSDLAIRFADFTALGEDAEVFLRSDNGQRIRILWGDGNEDRRNVGQAGRSPNRPNKALYLCQSVHYVTAPLNRCNRFAARLRIAYTYITNDANRQINKLVFLRG